jgi:hypothetical protein
MAPRLSGDRLSRLADDRCTAPVAPDHSPADRASRITASAHSALSVSVIPANRPRRRQASVSGHRIQGPPHGQGRASAAAGSSLVIRRMESSALANAPSSTASTVPSSSPGAGRTGAEVMLAFLLRGLGLAEGAATRAGRPDLALADLAGDLDSTDPGTG